jgi:hypothetical protein
LKDQSVAPVANKAVLENVASMHKQVNFSGLNLETQQTDHVGGWEGSAKVDGCRAQENASSPELLPKG